tara:strand:- start:629 stop:1840 length:1212 start_codon:yes stop_codon:yes gene_type:complete
MNIGIIFDTNNKSGGGFFQSLSSAITINRISDKNFKFVFIVFSEESEKILQSNGLKTINFKSRITFDFYKRITKINIISKFLNKIRYKNSFFKFLNKNKINFLIFLGPSDLINYIENINFSYTVYDIQHKFYPFFPEYKGKDYYSRRDKILQEAVNKSFKILVDTDRTKKDMNFYYNCSNKKLVVQPFIPLLPKMINEKKDYSLNENLKKKINLKENQKYFFYPAQFWAHKNHRYIIDFLNIQSKNNNNTYKVVCCGSKKSNRDFINKLVQNHSLENQFIIFDYLSDDEVIQLYKNCFGLLMPTYVARSTLPLYESFFLKKPVFYSNDILDEKLYDYVIGFDLKNPKNLVEKIEKIESGKIDLNNLTNLAFDYFNNMCNEELFVNNYKKILTEYDYLRKRWEI